jgi:hypothetical protein
MTITFDNRGTFVAYNAACDWLTERGFSHGSMSRPFPTAIKKGDFHIAKWKNLTAAERRDIDGTIEGDFREGPVTVNLPKET